MTRSKKNQLKIYFQTQVMAKIVFEANSCKFKLQLLKIEIQVHKQKLQQICDTVQKESINLDLKHKSYKQYKIRTILFLKQKRN